MSQLYDVIIIGAGPGGSCCAFFLAQKQLRVLLLEQARLPRHKICGGAVPASLFEALPWLKGRISDAIPLTHVRYSFRGTRICERSTSAVKVYSVERSDFDHSIIKEALLCNTFHLQENKKVISLNEEDDYISVSTSDGFEARGRYGIIASGAASSLSRLFARRGRGKREFGCASHMVLRADERITSLYEGKVHIDFAYIKNGYAGIIPKRDHLVVCLYQKALSSRSHLLKKTEQFLQDLGIEGESGPFSMRAFEVYDPGRAFNTGRLFAVGDAAALVDPLSGEGIRHAAASARIAAETIEKLFLTGGNADEYSERIRQEIGKELLIARQFVRIGHAFPAFTYGGLINVSEEAGDVLNGNLSYSVLLARLRRRIGAKLRRMVFARSPE
jgi:geranylgeranyl reductase family protein